MSDYPRVVAAKLANRSFPLDRFFASVRVAMVIYSSLSYYLAFLARWQRVAPDLSIFVWAPPLGSHLTTQISGLIHGVYVAFGIWYGRGWAMAYVSLTSLAACIQLLIQPSGPGFIFFGTIYLPTFVYCGLRLIGTVGPPTAGFELRRRTQAGSDELASSS